MSQGNKPDKQVLLGLILEREGYISRAQVIGVMGEQARLRQQGRYVAFGELALELKFIATPQLQRALQLQAKLAVPPGGRKRLGYYLLEAGLVTPSQLIKGLERQAESGLKLGEALIELGWLTDTMLSMFLTLQQNETEAKARSAPPAPPAKPGPKKKSP